MIDIDTKEIKQLSKNLQAVSKTAYPKAVRSTLDRMAFLGLKEYKKNVKQKFVIRNASSNIVLKSMRYQRCSNTLDISQMAADVGQAATTYGKKTEQLKRQEFGDTIVARGKHIKKPTKSARGGSYKKTVRQENYLNQIKISKIEDLVAYPAKTEFKQFRQAIAFAIRNKNKKYHLVTDEDYRGWRGIFELNGQNENHVATTIYSLKGKTQTLKKQETLKPMIPVIGAQVDEIFVHEAQRRITKELQKQLKSA